MASLPAERKAGLLPFACGAVGGAVMVSLSSAVRVVANEQSRVTATLTAIPTRSLSR